MRGRVGPATVASVGCAVLAYGAAILASAPATLDGRGRLVLAAGAAFTLVSVGIPAVEQVRRQRQLRSAQQAASDARAQLRTAFNDTLAPGSTADWQGRGSVHL